MKGREKRIKKKKEEIETEYLIFLNKQIANTKVLAEETLVPELAARKRETEKLEKYSDTCPPYTSFVPLVMETYGRWGQQSRPIFQACMDLASRQHSEVSCSSILETTT